MESQPRFILLSGFAACGKSTLAERYINDHPLALHIDGDEIITKLGQWRAHSNEAVTSKLLLTGAMAASHLHAGYDVILPILPGENYTSPYEDIAREARADFLEIFIEVEKQEAIKRLLARGTWGEKGLPPITEENRPRIEHLYDEMNKAVAQRPQAIRIPSTEGDIEGTYQALINAI